VFARVMPENTPSLRLLEVIGFTCEGTEYACTQIQGKWEDHIRYALLNPYSSI
jgi:ribosomal-protein-alanine N-acetyltransferase